MNNKPFAKLKVILTTATAWWLIPLAAWAAFSLSVVPYEGGYDLRFGKVGLGAQRINKEVRVQINSDAGKQYQLVQMAAEPLANSQGGTIPSQNFLISAVSGSNRNGVMNLPAGLPLSFGRTLVYTSNSAGVADSFVLVYSLQGPFNMAPGLYRGKVVFTLESISGSETPVTAVMNVSAEIESSAIVEIKTTNGSNLLAVRSGSDNLSQAQVLINISVNLGSQFRVVQSLAGPLFNQAGDELNLSGLTYEVSGISGSGYHVGPAALSLGQDTLFTSDPSSGQVSLVVTYCLVNPEAYSAGIYRGKLKIYLESPVLRGIVKDFDLEVEIPRVFDFVVAPEMGGSILFRNVGRGDQPQIYQVAMSVRSNIGKRYQVTQELLAELANSAGKIIPMESFTLRQIGEEDTRGSLKYLQKQPMSLGSMVLYVSDAKGASDSFQVIYELAPSMKYAAGDYTTRITYSLSEI